MMPAGENSSVISMGSDGERTAAVPAVQVALLAELPADGDALSDVSMASDTGRCWDQPAREHAWT
jgi:hypothetical protein